MPVDPQFETKWITVNVNDKQFTVSDESVYEEDFQRRGANSGSQKIWVCKWADRMALANALLGGASNIFGGVVVANGWQYPDNPAWFVQHIRSRPVGKWSAGNNQIQYEYARLFIDFAPPSWDLLAQNNMGAFQIDFAVESVALSDQQGPMYEFNDGAVGSRTQIDLNAAPVLYYGVSTLWTTAYDRTQLNLPLINSLMFCTNNAVMGGAAVESLMFIGARSQGQITASGKLNEDINLGFKWHSVPGGWNKKPFPGKNPLWQPYVVKGTNSKEFPPTDLTPLLRM